MYSISYVFSIFPSAVFLNFHLRGILLLHVKEGISKSSILLKLNIELYRWIFRDIFTRHSPKPSKQGFEVFTGSYKLQENKTQPSLRDIQEPRV
jgi:hypothetical protein